MTEQADAYGSLAGKHGFAESERYLRVLRFLMTPEQAKMVAQLPGSPEEVARSTGFDLAHVKQSLELLLRKGVVVPKDYKTPDQYMFCKYAERLWEVTESLMGLDIYTEAEN